MISGRERVLFDPAGTFVYDGAPERHDVKYGMSDRSVNVYQDFHVRPDFNLVEQTLVVPQSVADDLIAMAEAAGPVDDAFCASSIVALLRSQPGFEGMRSTLFPRALSDDFGRLPGVNTILRTQENFVAFHGVPFVDEEPVNLTN